MNTLFNMKAFDNQAEEQVHAGTGRRCRQCAKRVRLIYGSGKAFSYCAIQTCGRTCLGIRKIKANDPACRSFELELAEREIETRAFNSVHVKWCAKELKS